MKELIKLLDKQIDDSNKDFLWYLSVTSDIPLLTIAEELGFTGLEVVQAENLENLARILWREFN